MTCFGSSKRLCGRDKNDEYKDAIEWIGTNSHIPSGKISISVTNTCVVSEFLYAIFLNILIGKDVIALS